MGDHPPEDHQRGCQSTEQVQRLLEKMIQNDRKKEQDSTDKRRTV
jgi:hypothetical protein